MAALSCFVDRKGTVSLVDCAKGNPNLEYQRLEFVFDLEYRKIAGSYEGHWPFVAEQNDYNAVCVFFDQLAGTPEKLKEFAEKGGLSKASLAALLEPGVRKTFLTICGALEKLATDECGAREEPCLEDGCAFKGTGDVCLNAVLLSGEKCLKSCISVWVSKFQNPENRIEIWRS